MNYDRGLWALERVGLRWRRRQLLRGVRGRVLEIGAGTGANVSQRPDPVEQWVATDVHFGRLSGVPHKDPSVPPACADAQALPFSDNSFDVVVGTLVFCSIPDPLRALAEIKRVLQPAGRLILMEHVRGVGPVARRFTDWAHPAWFALQGECHLNRETPRLVRQSGFEIRYFDQSGWFGILAEIEARPVASEPTQRATTHALHAA